MFHIPHHKIKNQLTTAPCPWFKDDDAATKEPAIMLDKTASNANVNSAFLRSYLQVLQILTLIFKIYMQPSKPKCEHQNKQNVSVIATFLFALLLSRRLILALPKRFAAC